MNSIQVLHGISGTWTNRSLIGCALAGLAFLLFALFDGIASDLILFTGGFFALLAGATALGPRCMSAWAGSRPVVLLLAVAWLAALTLSYVFSLSKDSSFAPALTLAFPVVGFLLARGLGRNGGVLLLACAAFVLVMACCSVLSLVTGDDRFDLSLTDRNNYATLLNLTLIAGTHAYLAAWWQKRRIADALHVLVLALLWLLFVALFSTGSRTGLLAMVAGFVVWGGLAAWRKLSLAPVALCILVAIAAFFASAALSGTSAAERMTEASVTSGIGIRFVLIGAALAMLDADILTGVGIFVFPLLYRSVRTTADLETTGLFVHNDYVQFLLEGGAPLFLVSVAFVVLVVVNCCVCLLAKPQSAAFSRMGIWMALAAAALHAATNFVFYTPALALLIGFMLALALPGAGAQGDDGGEALAAPSPRPLVTAGLGSALVFGWVCSFYLVVDTLSAGVFGGQAGVPFASAWRDDPDRMLALAVAVQKLNGDRGLPVLVEASLLERKHAGADADRLGEVLTAYRRAIAADRWNGQTWLSMALFVDAHPRLAQGVAREESPEALVLAGLGIDPLFIPGIDWFVNRYEQTGKPHRAYELVRDRVLPWLRYLARENPEAAVRYFRYLDAAARRLDDAAVLAELERLRGAG